MDFEVFRQAGWFARLGLVISAMPLVMGIAFAIWPDERRLAQMRPLSLAGLFAAVSNLFVGLANGLYALNEVPVGSTPLAYAGLVLAEACVLTFVGFAFLTVAWLCVAIGTRKVG
jgi:hypothetical protein